MFALTGFYLLLATAVLSSAQSTYKAAVVEYNTKPKTSNFDNVATNVKNYIEFINAASSKNVDIVVFPKSTLNDINTTNRADSFIYAYEVPDPLKQIIPCDSNQYNEALYSLSCAAKSSQVYALVNLIEKSCTDDAKCSSVKHNLYNTNILFDKTGKIISRHRTAYRIDDVNERKIESFVKCYNDTVEHLMDLDQLFDKLSHDLLEVKNFPEYWSSELLLSTGIQQSDVWTYYSEINDNKLPAHNDETTKESTKKNNKLYFYMATNREESTYDIKSDKVENDNYESIFKYILNKLQIVTFIIIIYFLEMM